MKVGVVGASIAGSYFAQQAASRGVEVQLFDPRAPWDKPCGGGITRKAMAALAEFPAIASAAEAITDFSLVAPSGSRVAFTTDAPLYLLPRVQLGRAIVAGALDAGATLVAKKVARVVREADGTWTLHADGRAYRGYDHLVGADGAVSTIRRAVDRPFAREDQILALDYHLPGGDSPPRVALEFLPGGLGYLWLFAARHYASVGIGLPALRTHAHSLKATLDDFLGREWPNAAIDRANVRRWVIPFHRKGFGTRYRIQGEGWSLVGDAAGLADPLTGEGIYYAVRSAELLADALAADRPADYGAAVELEMRPELSKAFGIGQDYFRERILDALVRGARRSPSLCAFLGEYLTGSADYRTARARLKRRGLRILGEFAWSLLGGGGRREGRIGRGAAVSSKKAP
jgi:flavin-dependent dehydrogenase